MIVGDAIWFSMSFTQVYNLEILRVRSCMYLKMWFKAEAQRDFPGGLVAKSLSSQCQGPRFKPWSGK